MENVDHNETVIGRFLASIRDRRHAGDGRPGRRCRARRHGPQLALHGAWGRRGAGRAGAVVRRTPASSGTWHAHADARWRARHLHSPLGGGRRSPTPRDQAHVLSVSERRIVRATRSGVEGAGRPPSSPRWPRPAMAERSPGLAELLGRADPPSGLGGCPTTPSPELRFERVVIDGEHFVLKYQDPRDDWILRAAGDPGRSYVRLWESGLLDRLPPVLDHAVVAAAFDGTVGMILLRDVGDALLQPDAPFTSEQHARYLDHMAALHAAFWGWRDDVGLTPLERRYLLFSPEVAAAEAAARQRGRGAAGHGRGVAAPGRRLAGHGPPRRCPCSPTPARSSPRWHACPTPWSTGTGRRPIWAATPTGARCCSTSARRRARPRPWQTCPGTWRSTRRCCPSRRPPCSSRIDTRSRGTACDTTEWWNDAVALELLGCMLQFGWEKALGGPGEQASAGRRTGSRRRARAASGVASYLDGAARATAPAARRVAGHRPEPGRLVRAGGRCPPVVVGHTA